MTLENWKQTRLSITLLNLFWFLVDGNWGSWSSYGKCSKTCGLGTQIRRRSCDKPPMSNGGKRCDGSRYEIRKCSIKNCPGTTVFNNSNVRVLYLMNLDSLLICNFWLREWLQDFLNQMLIRIHDKIKNEDHARIV